MTEWHHGEITKRKVPVRPVRVFWICPEGGCGGEMLPTGMIWPTGDPGYHHKCSKCGICLAVHGGTYPRIEYEEEEENVR